MSFDPRFTITNPVAASLTEIERARGFLRGATLSEDWVDAMRSEAFVLEAHHSTHIEGTGLTLEQARRLLAGVDVPEADPDDAREPLNYREAFDFVTDWTGEYALSDRQTVALGHVMEHGRITIGDFEQLCDAVSRRTLQRDLKGLVEKGLLSLQGGTYQAEYVPGAKL